MKGGGDSLHGKMTKTHPFGQCSKGKFKKNASIHIELRRFLEFVQYRFPACYRTRRMIYLMQDCLYNGRRDRYGKAT